MRKFFHLPWQDKCLLLSAAVWLALIRVGLFLFSFATLRRFLDQAAHTRANARVGPLPSSDRVVWAVMAACHNLPLASTCLTRALATQVMLARRRLPSRFIIGVTKGDCGNLEAHAWLEHEGRVIIGGPDVTRFTPLAAASADCLAAMT